MPTAPCTITPQATIMPQRTKAWRCRPPPRHTTHSRPQTASSSVQNANFVLPTRRMASLCAPGASIAGIPTPTDRPNLRRVSGRRNPIRDKSRPALAMNRLRLVRLHGPVGGSLVLLLPGLLIVVDRRLVLLITGLLVAVSRILILMAPRLLIAVHRIWVWLRAGLLGERGRLPAK